MRTILIDPATQTVTEIQVESDLKALQHAIGDNDLEGAYPRSMPGHILYVDDEGRLKPNYGFSVVGWPHAIGGKAIVRGGPDRDGKDMAAILSVKAVQDLVTWI